MGDGLFGTLAPGDIAGKGAKEFFAFEFRIGDVNFHRDASAAFCAMQGFTGELFLFLDVAPHFRPFRFGQVRVQIGGVQAQQLILGIAEAGASCLIAVEQPAVLADRENRFAGILISMILRRKIFSVCVASAGAAGPSLFASPSVMAANASGQPPLVNVRCVLDQVFGDADG